jgi:uncharacterized YigZ family protein
MTSFPSDEYLTIKGQFRSKTKVEGSIFIATAMPVDSEQLAEESIRSISSEFFDATHNCFAFRIKQTQGEILKSSDAGEPRGTAGKPISSAIESENLHNVLVVVTRYFGGVKLGTGGLARTYRQAAQSVLQEAEKVKKYICSELSFSYPSGMTGKVSQIFSQPGVEVKNRGFEKEATAQIIVRVSVLEKVKTALVEATNGQIKFD